MGKLTKVLWESDKYRLVGTGWLADGFWVEQKAADRLGACKWDQVVDSDSLKELLTDDQYTAIAYLFQEGKRVVP